MAEAQQQRRDLRQATGVVMAVTSNKTTYYTLVQHTGYTAGGDSSFARAVEERVITEGQAAKVRRAGGLTFTDYGLAEAAAYNECYPPEVEGLIASVRGHFAKVAGIGEPVYIPSA